MSNTTGPAERAHRLVSEMMDRYQAANANGSSPKRQPVKPDVQVFTTLIKACTSERVHKAPALRIALKAFHATTDGGFGPPTEVTYMLLVRAIRTLSSTMSEREIWLEKVLRSLRCVSPRVVEELHRASPRIAERLARGQSLSYCKMGKKRRRSTASTEDTRVELDQPAVVGS